MIRGNKSHITIFLILGFVEKFELIKSLPHITLRSVDYNQGK